MASGIITPSYKSGFYSPKRGGVPKYPELWRGCVGAWCPALGNTGSRLFDQSLYGNHGTLTNMDAATDWVVNDGYGTLDFDGSNDVVTVADSNSLDISTTITMCGWANIIGSLVDYQCVFEKARATSYALYTCYAGSNQLRAIINIAGTRRDFIPNPAITIARDQWAHFAATFDGTTTRLWLNGAPLASTSVQYSGAIGTDTTSLSIGKMVGFAGPNSQLNDARLYNRALTSSELKLLASRIGVAYEARRPAVKASAAAFKAYWSRRQSHIIGGGVS